MAKATQVTDSNFEREVLQSDVPVLVDFWAPWCGPCRALSPAIEALAEELEGEVKVVKYNTQENNRIAGRIGIRSIPTLAIFRDGDIVAHRVGALPPQQLRSWTRKGAGLEPGIFSKLFSGRTA